jgi:acetolactate synthase I/III small subunit
MKLIAPFGILESARTGKITSPDTRNATLLIFIGLMALPRSPLYGPHEEMEKEAQDLVDASTLPPG